MVTEDILIQRGTTLVRRLCLAPGEALPWYRDPFHRITVVLRGDALAVEYQEGGARRSVPVTPGQVDWDEPTERLHRAMNVGQQPYEEITIFFLDRPGAVARLCRRRAQPFPQPQA